MANILALKGLITYVKLLLLKRTNRQRVGTRRADQTNAQCKCNSLYTHHSMYQANTQCKCNSLYTHHSMYQANTLLFGNNSHFGKKVITPPFNTLVGPRSNSYQWEKTQVNLLFRPFLSLVFWRVFFSS